jgi:hypothetical protein
MSAELRGLSAELRGLSAELRGLSAEFHSVSVGLITKSRCAEEQMMNCDRSVKKRLFCPKIVGKEGIRSNHGECSL